MTTVTAADSALAGNTAATDVTDVNSARFVATGVNLSSPTSVLATTQAQVNAGLVQATTLADIPVVNINTTAGAVPTGVGITQPTADYKWNLPPHDWSLPVRPVKMDSELVGSNEYASFHGLRRGRLWFWAGAADLALSSSVSSAFSTVNSVTSSITGSTAVTDAGTSLKTADNWYGFQFLWNPTSISTSVVRNMDITPSPADTLKVVAGAFPGQETVSLSIMLDRVNDFACIKAYGNTTIDVTNQANSATSTTQAFNQIKAVNQVNNDYSTFSKYYTNSYPLQSNTPTTSEKIQKLMNQGTMADLEYLFKAVNGGYAWQNLLGKETANIGFLMPTLLGIQLGPTLDSLSYVGWITNIGIQHTDFTENMIPVRTIVSISIDCFAGSGIKAV